MSEEVMDTDYDPEQSGKIGVSNSATEKLAEIVNSVRSLEEDKKAVQEDIKNKYDEAKALGYDKKVLRQVVKELDKDPGERQEEYRLKEMYLNALGIFV